MADWLVDLVAALQNNRDTGNGRPDFTEVHYGSLRVGVYEPRGTDPQKPHDQDEIYIIETGSGIFYRDGMAGFQAGRPHLRAGGDGAQVRGVPRRLPGLGRVWGPKGGEGPADRRPRLAPV